VYLKISANLIPPLHFRTFSPLVTLVEMLNFVRLLIFNQCQGTALLLKSAIRIKLISSVCGPHSNLNSQHVAIRFVKTLQRACKKLQTVCKKGMQKSPHKHANAAESMRKLAKKHAESMHKHANAAKACKSLQKHANPAKKLAKSCRRLQKHAKSMRKTCQRCEKSA
jgi:hypothetical protein